MRLLIIALVLVGTAAAAPVFSTEIPQFRRGDVTGDGALNIADPTVLIEIVYNNGPGQMVEFVTSTVGSFFVAGSVLLQAVGIAWMNLVSKPRF